MLSGLFLFLAGTTLAAQPLVKGTVVDGKGDPLAGVTVQVKGTGATAMSGADGNYAIAAPADATLVFSFVGYATQEIPTGGRSIINVTLDESAVVLAEVVAIGYGTERKENLSTAVAIVHLDRTMKSRPANISSALQGQLPGLTVQFDGGDPLSGQTYNIRGKGSRDSDGILWVVDGVPGAPYTFEDVESVTVLKDAASAAIYGASVGSGGVIILTTKQARAGKLKLDVNVSHSFQQAANLPTTLNSEQLNKLWRDVIGVTNTAMTLPAVFDAARYPYGVATRTDWVDEIFRTGQVQHYAVSLSGGSDAMKAFASFAYDKTDGLLINTWRDQLSGKVSADFKLTKWATVSQKATVQYSNGQGGIRTGSHESYIVEALGYPRSATVYEYDQQGNLVYGDDGEPLYGGTTPLWSDITGYGAGRNPVASLNRLRQKRPATTAFSTSSLELRPLAGLIVRSDFTASLNASRYEEFVPRITELGRPNPENSRYVSSAWETHWLWETTASYAAVFDKHHISAMAGYTMQRRNYRNVGTTTTLYDREDEHYTIFTNAGEWSKTRPTESIWDESMLSGLGRVGYSYDDRYFATASLRYDATSKLAPENNGQLFPAFSGSWKLSSEAFFDGVPAISLLKLRGSWGRVGDCGSVPRYSYNAPLGKTSDPGVLGRNIDVLVYGDYQETIANRSLVWETTEQTGFGIDLSLLQALDITIDYFHKTTKDLIDELPSPSVAGIPRDPRGNVGKVRNTGWEFSVRYQATAGELKWSVYGNASTVRSEVLDLSPRELMNHSLQLQSAVGQPWYAYSLIDTDGIFQSFDEINAYTKDGKPIQPNARPGDLKFIDYNNDGNITNDDRQFMGSYLPSLTAAFGGTLEFRGVDFSIYFQGVGGVKIYNAFRQNAYLNGAAGSNMFSEILNAWNYNVRSGHPRISWLDDNNQNYSRASAYWLETGDYLRLKNVTLGYTLPARWLRGAGVDLSVRLYAGAENLFTFTSYSGFDPEVGSHGVDGGAYPVARTFIIGLNVNF